MIKDYNKIFNQRQCLTHKEMIGYLYGKISQSEKLNIEMHLADCEMCNDEMDGLALMKDNHKLNEIVTELNTKICKSAFDSVYPVKRSRKFNLIRITAVAASAVIVISAGIYLYYLTLSKTEELAEMSNSKQSETVDNEFNNSIKDKNTESSNNINKKTDLISNDVTNEKVESSVISPERNIVNEESPPVVDKIESEDITVYGGISNVNTKTLKENTDDLTNATLSDINEDVLPAEDEKIKSENKPDLNFGYKTRSADEQKLNKDKKVEDKYKSLRASALFSYTGNVYSEAIHGFEEYLNQYPNDIEIVYKAGFSKYMLKEYSVAATYFNTVITNGTGKYFDDAEWYKTQCFIKQNKLEFAIPLLKQIVSKNGKYKNDAQKLLNSLN